MPLKNISATAVRAQIEQPESRSGSLEVLVPKAVAGYISTHSLYQNPT
jgi:nicotinate-nucleotide adenylyltransferase